MIPAESFEEWLQGRLAYWQEVLRLQDWRIGIELLHLRDVQDGPGDPFPNAQVRCDVRRRHARIEFCHPEEMAHAPVGMSRLDPLDEDAEVILVHELLHISMWDMDAAVPESIDHPGSLFEVGQERHIMNLSKALVALARQGDSAGIKGGSE